MDCAIISPYGMTVLNEETRRAPRQPYNVRREFAQVNHGNTALYQATRIYIAMLFAGLA